MSQILLNNELKIDEILAMREKMQPVAMQTFCSGSESVHLPSAIVRNFKDSRAVGSTPVSRAMAAGFAQLAVTIAKERRITHICRALGSWETLQDSHAPLDLFTQALSHMTGLPLVQPMRRTTPRPPMSSTGKLAGQDAFVNRVQVAAADLVYKPVNGLEGARVLVIDDVRCIGATETVWGWALSKFNSVSQSISLNLAQMENADHRCLNLETDSELLRQSCRQFCSDDVKPAFDPLWIENRRKVMHLRDDCSSVIDAKMYWWRCLLGEGFIICPECSQPEKRSLRSLFGRLKAK